MYELREKSGRNGLPLVRALLSRSTQNSHPIGWSFYTFTPPYISNVVSLELDLDKHDLHERLWPLLSGRLCLPQTTTIHVEAFDYSFNRDESESVRSLVSTIGRVHFRLLPCEDQRWETYLWECRVGDVPSVRRRINDFNITIEDGLLQFFREDASVKRLVFSVSGSAFPGAESGDRAVDLRAFPHLTHLDGYDLNVETSAPMLQSGDAGGCVEGEPGQAAALIFPSLADLVVDIRCAFVHRSAAASGSDGRPESTSESPSALFRPDTIAGVDELVRRQRSVPSLRARPPEIASSPSMSVFDRRR